MSPAQPTKPTESSDRAQNADVAFRRAMLVLLSLLVAWGAFGMLGVRSAVAVDEAAGYRLSVEYASVTRPGLATPFEITVTREDELPTQLALEVTSSYLGAFDENGLAPQPVGSYADSEFTRWTFAIPERTAELTVSFDARLEPAVQWARSARVGLIVDGRPVAGVELTTWVTP